MPGEVRRKPGMLSSKGAWRVDCFRKSGRLGVQHIRMPSLPPYKESQDGILDNG